MTFYPTAAACQEAGYRPCLRCRPESSPDLGAWRGTSNTVSRALALIEAGAMDNGDVDGLAVRRLGVGERQLRRLFKQHLGASPVAVAQTRRVPPGQAADPGDPVTRWARWPWRRASAASGASMRPSSSCSAARRALLRRSRAEEASAAAGGITVKLPYKPPYDWTAMIGFLAARAIPGVESVTPKALRPHPGGRGRSWAW